MTMQREAEKLIFYIYSVRHHIFYKPSSTSILSKFYLHGVTGPGHFNSLSCFGIFFRVTFNISKTSFSVFDPVQRVAHWR